MESRQLAVHIDRPAPDVYAYASDPRHLPEWAAGLATSIDYVDGAWMVSTPDGPIVIAFAEPNPYGVLDHDVTMPSGETTYNPMRVTADGAGSEVVFSLRRAPEMSDEDFDRDAEAVLADLRTLKARLEA
jgi:hypothetical protein